MNGYKLQNEKVCFIKIPHTVERYVQYRQGIYCNNLANWVTEIFEVDMTSMMVGRQFKPWAHSRKFVVVT